MQKNDCRVGMRIVCLEEYCGDSLFKEKTGTIVYISPNNSSTQIGVEWDELVEDITGGIHPGHDCNGRCTGGYGYYGSAIDVDPLYESDDYYFTISIDSLFE